MPNNIMHDLRLALDNTRFVGGLDVKALDSSSRGHPNLPHYATLRPPCLLILVTLR